MKTLKTIITLLLMTVSMAVNAQTTIVAVEKTDGTIDNYNLADVDSVVYEPKTETVLGYYSFNATSSSDASSLTESDFTSLTSTISEVTCGVTSFPIVLTLSSTAPSMAKYSAAFGTWTNDVTMKAGVSAIGGSTKEINGVTYNLWYTSSTASDSSKIRITIN